MSDESEVQSELAVAVAYLALATSYYHGYEIAGGHEDSPARFYGETAYALLRPDLPLTAVSALQTTQTLLMLGYQKLNAGFGAGLLERAFSTLHEVPVENKVWKQKHSAAAPVLREARFRTVWSCFVIHLKLSIEREVPKVLYFDQMCCLPLPCSESSFLWGREVETSFIWRYRSCQTASLDEIECGGSEESEGNATRRVRREDSGYGYYYVIMATLHEVTQLFRDTVQEYAFIVHVTHESIADRCSANNTSSTSDELAAKHAALGHDLDRIMQNLPGDLQLTVNNTYDYAHRLTNDPVDATIYFQLHSAGILTEALLLWRPVKDAYRQAFWTLTCDRGPSIFDSDSPCSSRITEFTRHVKNYMRLLFQFWDNSEIVMSSFTVVTIINVIRTGKRPSAIRRAKG